MSDQGLYATKVCTKCRPSFDDGGNPVSPTLVKRGRYWCCRDCGSSYGERPHPDLAPAVMTDVEGPIERLRSAYKFRDGVATHAEVLCSEVASALSAQDAKMKAVQKLYEDAVNRNSAQAEEIERLRAYPNHRIEAAEAEAERIHANAKDAIARAALAAADSVQAIDVAHLKRQREWSEKTFGPGARTLGILDHIRKELDEIANDPTDVMEWVDVIILAFDGAWRAGWPPDQIIQAIKEKQAANEERTWPDWRTQSQDKAIEHDRAADSGQEPVAEKGKSDD